MYTISGTYTGRYIYIMISRCNYEKNKFILSFKHFYYVVNFKFRYFYIYFEKFYKFLEIFYMVLATLKVPMTSHKGHSVATPGYAQVTLVMPSQSSFASVFVS